MIGSFKILCTIHLFYILTNQDAGPHPQTQCKKEEKLHKKKAESEEEKTNVERLYKPLSFQGGFFIPRSKLTKILFATSPYLYSVKILEMDQEKGSSGTVKKSRQKILQKTTPFPHKQKP